MRSKLLPLCAAALLACASGASVGDDGVLINKSMSRTIKVPVFAQENVNAHVPEAEHAFTDMLLFYVPMQAASGATADGLAADDTKDDPRDYIDIDEYTVETLPVAKPLVNTFIYGPTIEVEHTAFGHSFMDTYAAVSLDDGMTWKQTNLSQSADQSSFNLDTDHVPGTDDDVEHHIPSGHTVLLAEDGVEGWHMPGYNMPYSNGCTDCHGETLQGAKDVSCYACHGNVWDEADPVEVGPTIREAEWEDSSGGKLSVEGENAPINKLVEVVNAVTKEVLGTDLPSRTGYWEIEENNLGTAPCRIAAVADGIEGPSIVPKNTPEECEGVIEPEVDLTDYPGGTYNVFQASSGNKVLVAWPSRFCSQGQPAYSFAYDGDDSDIIASDPDKAAELIAKRNAVASLLDIDVTKDLYLSDLFEVSGSQGSIDFADESYPQAGVVPFGCVWTARGVLLPGDDPRTADVAEQTHMVWTKAERLTSGRRDPNRIEVQGLKGAGFVITWQEDPDGLRPGQGEGPGEGWSGAVAHDKTDVWYSFIPWEYFDLVENPDDPTGTPVNIADHVLGNQDTTDEADGGRPQVYVPMAMPMRLTNNDKCGPEYNPTYTDADGNTGGITDPTDKKYFSYCNYVVAKNYGLQDFCANTVEIPQGKDGTLGSICVNAEGLPNIANTAATRPRTALQGYDSDGDGAVDSGWVIVATEESKGLGRYAFLPDGTPCDEEAEDASPDCGADIGKNIWYFSFDMGDPTTSATADEPNGLVKSLVSQGNLLNQPEIDWRTGKFYPVINTAEMWDFGDYNYDLYNTEIARRSSLLSQGISKAVGSLSGLTALPSWKQGAMNQGGPADTMFRRITLPDGYGGCPITVDPDGPYFTKGRVNRLDRLRVEGGGLDGRPRTRVTIRNAVTGEQLAKRLSDIEPDFAFGFKITGDDNVLQESEVPCAIQVSDGRAENWGPIWEVTNAPEGCSGPLPAACTAGAATVVAASDTLPGIEVNPYAFANMECESWLVGAGTNPYYPGGICGAPATNLSGVVPDTCKDDGTGEPVDCPTVDFSSSTFGIGDTNPILQGYIQGEGNTTRVLTWHQCPSDGVQSTGDITAVTCGDDSRPDTFVNLKDQSWYNPLDVSKGHRGFLDGDFVMFLYGWSPNWRLNAKGNDRYDLYIRRSFDGGQTWTTLPESFAASDGDSYAGNGTVTCETYRAEDTGTSGAPEPHVCYAYRAGGNEQARNVTQHKRMRITTLDPRYAPSGGPRGQSIAAGCVDRMDPTVDPLVMTCDDMSAFDTDLRNPSRYAMVYEVGDNSTVSLGEAEPLDLFYSRAESFGDNYVVWAETDTASAVPTLCYPSDPHGDEDIIGTAIEGSGFCNEFDRMNTRGDTHSSEADLELNPAGTKLYGVWTQWVYENDDIEADIIESDAMARRVWWIDGYISATLDNVWTLPGTSQDTTTP